MCAHELSCHAVALVHIREAVVAAEAVAVHDSLHQTADVAEADLILEEELDGLLVGTVGGAGAETALSDGLLAGGEAAERLLVRRGKRQRRTGEQIQRRRGILLPHRIRQRKPDGDAHVGRAELRHHRAVTELDERVDDRLPVDDRRDL